MLVALPALAYLAIFAATRRLSNHILDRLMLAAALWGSALAVITECASALHVLTRGGVAILWILVLAAAAILARHQAGAEPSTRETSEWRLSGLTGIDRALLCGISLVLLLILVDALASPPNAWDAMDYHLPRVMLWISDRSVRFYPTWGYAQLVFSPWAEYAMLHLMVLSGSDRLVNLVEWSSLVGVVVLAWLIARALGAASRGAAVAAVAAATLPSGVLESSGALNGIVVSFWIMLSVYLAIKFVGDSSWWFGGGSACAAGLALLTKGTAYAILPPILAGCWFLGSNPKRLRVLRHLPVFAVIVVALNAGFWIRNLELTGNPFGNLPGVGAVDHMVGRFSLGGTAANLVRDLSLDATTPSGHLNLLAQRATLRAIRWLGQDPSDPAYLSYIAPDRDTYSKFKFNSPNRNETWAGDPLHLLLLSLALAIIIMRRAGGLNRRAFIYALGLIASFVFFAALLRWQSSGARLQTPLFLLGVPLIGYTVDTLSNSFIAGAVGAVMIAAALPYALGNELRPLVPTRYLPNRVVAFEPLSTSIWSRDRASLYFADEHADLAQVYRDATEALLRLDCDEIGFDTSLEHFEYPVMAGLEVAGGRRRVRYVGVANTTSRYAEPERPVCAVICFACAKVPHKTLEYRAVGGHTQTFGSLVIFSREGAALPVLPAEPPEHRPSAAAIIAHAQAAKDRLDDVFSDPASWDLFQSSMRLHGSEPLLAITIEQRYWGLIRYADDGSQIWARRAPMRAALAGRIDQLALNQLIDDAEALEAFGTQAAAAQADFANFARPLAK
jgi:hypothetical protein